MQLVRNIGVVCGHQDGNLGVPLALHVKQPNPYPVGINLPRTLKDRKKIFECNLLRGEVIFSCCHATVKGSLTRFALWGLFQIVGVFFNMMFSILMIVAGSAM